jgi:hypothetical protein
MDRLTKRRKLNIAPIIATNKPNKPHKPSTINIGHCLICNVYMGEDCSEQLCNKIDCFGVRLI